MKILRVLILINGLKIDVKDDIERWRKYEEERLGIHVVCDFKQSNITPLKHKSFGVLGVSRDAQGNVVKQELYGLDNIKSQIREAGVVPEGMYHAVIFFYDFEGTEMYTKNPGAVAHWCYWDQLYPGTDFIESPTTKIWDDWNDVFRVITHEARHMFVSRARRRGVSVPDVMDVTYVPIDCNTKNPNPLGRCVAGIPYYKEHDPFAPDGNRAVQDVLIRPHLEKTVLAPELTGYIRQLLDAVADLKKKLNDLMKTSDSQKLIRWAEGIKKHEGWEVGSRSYRNNNPGNFRAAPFIKSLGAIGEDRKGVRADQLGYAIFPSYEVGWQALLEFLRTAQKNQLVSYRKYAVEMGRERNMPLLKDWFAVYAPDGDNVPVGLSTSLKYARDVAEHIGNGVTVETPIDRI